METLRAAYRDDDEEDSLPSTEPAAGSDNDLTVHPAINSNGAATTTESPDVELRHERDAEAQAEAKLEPGIMIKEEATPSEDPSSDELSDNNQNDLNDPPHSPKFTKVSETEEDEDDDEDCDNDNDEEEPPPKKQKALSSLNAVLPPAKTKEEEEPSSPPRETDLPPASGEKGGNSSKNSKSKSKSKKKNNNVWTKPTSRKGKKKAKANGNGNPSSCNGKEPEDKVFITPIPRFPDKNDDSSDVKICLSKVYKAEKVELSDDRLSAGSSKGYRMVRATRGVVEGAWYFEIKVVNLGESGHTRLGWSTDKGDLQAPVGYDANSFGYRDIDGSKVHKALREQYGQGYGEGDVIGFYISLPEGSQYAPDPPKLVWYKGQRYVCGGPEAKEDSLKVVPGSEISFFKNGICQSVAFKDLYGGRYFPAASMYTLPNQPNCVVKFNFGPDFEFFPADFGGRPAPKPMIEVPYHGFDGRVENGVSNEKKN